METLDCWNLSDSSSTNLFLMKLMVAFTELLNPQTIAKRLRLTLLPNLFLKYGEILTGENFTVPLTGIAVHIQADTISNQ